MLIKMSFNDACVEVRIGKHLFDTFRIQQTKKKNSVSLVRKPTVSTERPPHVDEVSANFCG
jgi:hypothetical protein